MNSVSGCFISCPTVMTNVNNIHMFCCCCCCLNRALFGSSDNDVKEMLTMCVKMYRQNNKKMKKRTRTQIHTHKVWKSLIRFV